MAEWTPGRSAAAAKARFRATQSLVSYMGFCWDHPSMTLIEIAWRWIVGVPFLCVLWIQAQRIVARIPPASAGLDRLNLQNPWVSSVILSDAFAIYRPSVVDVLRWLLPTGLVAWAIVSGIGRMLVLRRMQAVDPVRGLSKSFVAQLPGVILLQGLWMAALLCVVWLWYEAVGWAAEVHINSVSEPNLIGYLCWLIFLSLGLFVFWSVTSWALASAPNLLVMENCSIWSALVRSFHLGRAMSSKLLEVNLVLGIVKIALIVLAMVFSAAPLPFSDQFGPDFMNLLYVVIAVAFLVANDYFHVVRLRSFVGLWRHYREVAHLDASGNAGDRVTEP